MSGILLCHSLSCSLQRQGLSRNLELGWQPVNRSDLPVFALHSAGSKRVHGQPYVAFLHWGSKLNPISLSRKYSCLLSHLTILVSFLYDRDPLVSPELAIQSRLAGHRA